MKASKSSALSSCVSGLYVRLNSKSFVLNSSGKFSMISSRLSFEVNLNLLVSSPLDHLVFFIKIVRNDKIQDTVTKKFKSLIIILKFLNICHIISSEVSI